MLNEDEGNNFHHLALTHHHRKNYAQAIEIFNEAIETNPSAILYRDRGYSKQAMKDMSGALEDYSMAIALGPDDHEVYFKRACLNQDIDEWENSVTDFDRAIELKPDYFVAFNNRGFSKSHMLDFEGSIVDYTLAIEVKSDYCTAYNNRGCSKRSIEDYEGSIKDFDMALFFKSDYKLAYVNRGVSKRHLERFDEAMEDFTIALKLDPDYFTALHHRGFLNDCAGNYAAAIIDYTTSININKVFPEGFSNRGYSKNQLGLYEEAILDFDLALEIDPLIKNSYSHKGFSYEKLGNLEEAMRNYNKSIELDPYYDHPLFQRARLKKILGDFEGCKQDTQKLFKKELLNFKEKFDSAILETLEFDINHKNFTLTVKDYIGNERNYNCNLELLCFHSEMFQCFRRFNEHQKANISHFELETHLDLDVFNLIFNYWHFICPETISIHDCVSIITWKNSFLPTSQFKPLFMLCKNILDKTSNFLGIKEYLLDYLSTLEDLQRKQILENELILKIFSKIQLLTPEYAQEILSIKQI